MIENLKGRRGYEEKRASKLGFASLYEYFEDKISKKQKALEDEQKELEAAKADDQPKAAVVANIFQSLNTQTLSL